MDRVENVVEAVRSRFALQFPVNVESLARQIARFEFVDESAPFEGMVLPINDDSDYQILIRKGGFDGRTRFTIAHEIGHVMIPWHYGTIIDTDVQMGEEIEGNREAEANHFAIELLALRWKRDEIIESDGLSSKTIVKMRRDFGISWLALARSLVPRLCRWQVLFRFSNHDGSLRVLHGGHYTLSREYVLRHLSGEVSVDGVLVDHCEDGYGLSGLAEIDNEYIIDWTFGRESGKIILKSIFEKHNIDEDMIKRINYKIGGILGAFNNQINESADPNKLVAVLGTRIAAYRELDLVTLDERFLEFRVSKIVEFFSRKQLEHKVGGIDP